MACLTTQLPHRLQLIATLLLLCRDVGARLDLELIFPQIHNRSCPAMCPSIDAITPNSPLEPTVFQDLSPAELLAVRAYLFRQADLNLSPVDDAGVNSSYIFVIDLEVPLKSAVLNHVDRQQVKPVRSARAVLFRGDLTPPVVEEYLVSPLPSPNRHQHVPFGSYTSYPIPFSGRPMSAPEYEFLIPLVDDVTEKIHELLVESYGVGAMECSDKCLYFEDQTQLNVAGKGRQTVFIGMRDLPGLHLHPIDTEILVSHDGSDVTQWKIEQIVYNNQKFVSAEELMAKYRSGLLTKLFLPFPGDFSSFKRRGSDPSGGKSGPRMYQPDGARYKVRGQHVEYMDWSFDFRIPPIRNVQLFDVRFQGQRIAYEISMQEMSSYYSGLSLHIISSSFADTAYMFTKFELVKGVDCPFEASYVDTYHLLDADETSHRKNVICVFEYDSSAPLARHYANDYDGGYTFYGGVSDYYLVLRTITSVYNYDYIIDVCFHNNGVVHVKVATTGYIIATYDRGGRRYGFPVHSDIAGSLHHHMYNFKVDLDILGESNRFASYDLVAETIPHPWIDNANKTQAYFKKIDKLSELDARVFYDFDQPRHYVIYSNDSTNSFGTKRGYRIVNDGMTKLLLPDKDIARNIRWGKYQLAVSKYKDQETFSSSPYNLNVAMDPLVDFDSFLSDDESIVDEDLVVWLTMGKHHLPTSEDVPAVSIAGKYRTFSLLPFNYFDEGPEVSSRDGVVIVPDGQHGGVVDTFGSSRPLCQPRPPGPLKYDGTW